MKTVITHSPNLIHFDVLMVHLLCTDADKAFSVERDGSEGSNDGSARLCGGAEIPPRPHLHLPGPGLHTLRHLPHRQRGG